MLTKIKKIKSYYSNYDILIFALNFVRTYIYIILYKYIFKRFDQLGSTPFFEGSIIIKKSKTGRIEIGDNCHFLDNVWLAALDGTIEIGNNCFISHHVIIESHMNIKIGNNVAIAGYTSIRDNNHGYIKKNTLIRNQGLEVDSVKIGNDVWIGRGCAIQKGVTISDGVVIGSNSVVTKNIPPYAVAVGAPAKVIKYRR